MEKLRDLGESVRGVIASAAAGLAGRLVCHPVDTIKSQLQAGVSPTWSFRAMYRGLGVALGGGIPATVMYLNTYDYSKAYLSREDLGLPSFAVHLTAGMVAETVSCLVFVPVDVIKERMQIQGLRPEKSPTNKSVYYRNTRDAIWQILAKEGIAYGFYKGYGATLLSFGPFSAAYFAIYESLKPLVAIRLGKAGKDGEETLLSNIVASASAGALASWLTNPLDLAKLRLQVDRMGGRSTAGGADSTLGMLRLVYRHSGVQGLYRGAFARVLFHAPSTAVTIVAFDEAKKVLAPR